MKLAILLLIFAIAATQAIAGNQSRGPTAAELYGPLPAATVKRMLAEHGLPPSLFTVVRKIPLELGGDNLAKNLMIISLSDLPDKIAFERIVLAQVRQDKIHIEAARKACADWTPAR